MTNAERKEKFFEKYREYSEEVHQCHERAKGAKNNGSKSNYEFWMQQAEIAQERADYFFEKSL